MSLSDDSHLMPVIPVDNAIAHAGQVANAHAARVVIFTSLVDDADDPNAPPEFVEACRKLKAGANASVEDTPRQRLFDFIERLVQWESTTDETVLNTARELIKLSTGGNPPPLLDHLRSVVCGCV